MRMPFLKRTLAMAFAMAAGAAVFSATPASATTYNGCVYPRVCFYLTDSDWSAGSPTAAYQDVTTSYQTLGSKSKGANWVYNTRNDDRALLRYLYGGDTYYTCLAPNEGVYFSSSFTVTGIEIQTASSC